MTEHRTNLDARLVPVSCAQPDALRLYEQALTRFHSYIGDPVAAIDEALAHAPDFALGHIFKAVVLMTMSEQRFVPEARSSVSAAQALTGRMNSRERGLTAAAANLVSGKWDAACAAFDTVLVDHPRDAFAIQSAHLMDFYRGDSLNLRNRVTRVLPHWSPDIPGYSYILGMHAFGLEECNQYPEAEEAGRRALEIQPRDAWAVHAVTHVMEMQGRTAEGVQWLESRIPDWAVDNGFAFHNWWHLALFYMDRGFFTNVLDLYDAHIHATPPDFVLQLLDATSLLWRLGIEGVDAGDRAQAAADNWAGRLEGERGFYAFNDFHAMMAFTLAKREREADQLIEDLEWALENGSGDNVMMIRKVGLPLCRAVRAFGQGRYREAVQWIEPVRDTAFLFGGSHAQRDVLTLTLIEACIRSGQHRRARHYLAERTVLRSGGRWGMRLLQRAAG